MPFDRNNPFGMKKLARYLDMGYTFDDPRKNELVQVVEPPKEVTEQAAFSTINQPEPEEKAPLYVSDKPEKKKKTKTSSRKKGG